MKTIRIVVDLGSSELQLTLTERAVKEVEMDPAFLQALKEKVLKEVRETMGKHNQTHEPTAFTVEGT